MPFEVARAYKIVSSQTLQIVATYNEKLGTHSYLRGIGACLVSTLLNWDYKSGNREINW